MQRTRSAKRLHEFKGRVKSIIEMERNESIAVLESSTSASSNEEGDSQGACIGGEDVTHLHW